MVGLMFTLTLSRFTLTLTLSRFTLTLALSLKGRGDLRSETVFRRERGSKECNYFKWEEGKGVKAV